MTYPRCILAKDLPMKVSASSILSPARQRLWFGFCSPASSSRKTWLVNTPMSSLQRRSCCLRTTFQPSTLKPRTTLCALKQHFAMADQSRTTCLSMALRLLILSKSMKRATSSTWTFSRTTTSALNARRLCRSMSSSAIRHTQLVRSPLTTTMRT